MQPNAQNRRVHKCAFAARCGLSSHLAAHSKCAAQNKTCTCRAVRQGLANSCLPGQVSSAKAFRPAPPPPPSTPPGFLQLCKRRTACPTSSRSRGNLSSFALQTGSCLPESGFRGRRRQEVGEIYVGERGWN